MKLFLQTLLLFFISFYFASAQSITPKVNVPAVDFATQQVTYDNLSVNIYPNPATDYVNVLITSDKNASNLSVRLFDLLGRTVNIPVANHSDGNQKLFTLNLNNLAATIYFVTVYDLSDNTTHTFKINKITR